MSVNFTPDGVFFVGSVGYRTGGILRRISDLVGCLADFAGCIGNRIVLGYLGSANPRERLPAARSAMCLRRPTAARR